jgi:hypothetical protein
MRAYGYELGDDSDEPRLLTLREASLACNGRDIRRLAKFVNDVLAEREEFGPPITEWHAHFRDLDPDWTEDESDLIIAFSADIEE